MSTIDIIDVKAGIEEDNERYVRKVRASLDGEGDSSKPEGVFL